jgi:hypothetical protein
MKTLGTLNKLYCFYINILDKCNIYDDYYYEFHTEYGKLSFFYFDEKSNDIEFIFTKDNTKVIQVKKLQIINLIHFHLKRKCINFEKKKYIIPEVYY